MTFTSLLLQLTFLVLPLLTWAEPRNVTVDDWDPSVTWVGSWTQTLPGFGKPFNGTYRTAKDDPSAYAEFKFTGGGQKPHCSQLVAHTSTCLQVLPYTSSALAGRTLCRLD